MPSTCKRRPNLPHRVRKKADQRVKLGCFNSRVIDTWDLTVMVAYGGTLNTGARSDLEEALVWAPAMELEVNPVFMLEGGEMAECRCR